MSDKWAGFAQGFADSFAPALQQSMRIRADERAAKLQAALDTQRRKDALHEQIRLDAAQYDVQPIIDSATGQLNPYATAAATTKARGIYERAHALQKERDRLNFDTETEARRLKAPPSITRSPTMAPQTQGLPAIQFGHYGGGNAPTPAFESPASAAPEPDLVREVYQLKQKAEQDKLAAAKKLQVDTALETAKATAPFREKYQDRGPYQVAGRYVGNPVRDTVTGEIGFKQGDQLVPLPDGAEPITASGLHKAIPSHAEFRKLKSDLTNAEVGLRSMDRYINSVGNANVGFQRLADNWSAGIKTLFGQGLNPSEIAAKMANGQLQGLLGASKLAVVGSGVLTETDALRVIERLGGDAGALSNPQIVRKALGEIYSDKFREYQDSVLYHNAAINDYYGSKGFRSVQPLKFSSHFVNDYEDTPAPPLPGSKPEDDVQALIKLYTSGK